MFNFLKPKDPRKPSEIAMEVYPEFQRSFATEFLQNVISQSMPGFIGAIVAKSDGVLVDSWKSIWKMMHPKLPVAPPAGMKVLPFREERFLMIPMVFPPNPTVGGAIFGMVVVGPCADPNFGPEALAAVSYRYFLLTVGEEGPLIEEWTQNPGSVVGPGPEPQLNLFVEWVMNCCVRDPADQVISVPDNSEEMAAAIARARAELPAVLQRFLDGELEDMHFTVKAPVSDGEATEHFWLSSTTYVDGYFTGIIDAQPGVVTNVTAGDSHTIWWEEVTDWMYVRDQKMCGNYTMRVLLPHMPPAEAAKYRDLLADD